MLQQQFKTEIDLMVAGIQERAWYLPDFVLCDNSTFIAYLTSEVHKLVKFPLSH